MNVSIKFTILSLTMRRRDSSWGADLAASGNRIPSIWSRPRLLMMMSASRRSCSVAAAVGDDNNDCGAAVCGATTAAALVASADGSLVASVVGAGL